MPSPPPRPPAVSTTGSWVGLGVCVWGAFLASVAAALMAAVLFVPWLVHLAGEAVAEKARASELPPEFHDAMNLVLEGTAILRPYAVTMGVCGACVGGLLFLAGFGLARGSDLARRAARALLVVAMLNTAADAAWNLTLLVTRFGPWFERFSEVADELGRQGPNRAPIFPPGLEFGSLANVASGALTTLLSLAVSAGLVWMTGRPTVRGWCAVRSGRSPIASPPAAG